MKLFGKIDSSIDTLIFGSGVISGFFIFATGMVVSYEVLMRYVFSAPTVWSFDITIFLILYATFIGTAFNIRENKHVRIEFFMSWISKYRLPSLLLKTFGDLIVSFFWVIVTWRAIIDTVNAYKMSEVTVSFLRFPFAIPLAAISIGGILILLQLSREIIKGVVSIKEKG